MRHPLALTLGVVLPIALVGCSPAYQAEYGLADNAVRTIDLRMGVSAESAQQRVQVAAVSGGWTVTQTSPGVVIVGPYALASDKGIHLTLRANVVASESGSRVVLSGSATDAFQKSVGEVFAGRQGEAWGENQPIVYAAKGRNAVKWAELARFAEAVRGASDVSAKPAAMTTKPVIAQPEPTVAKPATTNLQPEAQPQITKPATPQRAPAVETVAADTGAYVGSIADQVYFKRWCSAVQDLAPSNRRSFATEEDAKRAGFRPSRIPGCT
jgi:hypothetical protein